MLDYLRQNSRSFLIYVFFTIIILVFVIQFGPQTTGCSPSSRQVAAKVYGHTIEDVELDMHFYRNFGFAIGRDVDLEMVLKYKRDLLQDVIGVYLLAEEAEKRGFRVSKKRLSEYIMDEELNEDYRYFQTDGEYDFDLYQRVIQSGFRTSTKNYEEFKARELLARDLLVFLEGQIKVSGQEEEDAYRREKTTVNLEYAAFSFDDYLEQVAAPAEEEISLWLEDDGNESQVAAYYLAEKDQYVKPAEANTRTILVKAALTDGPTARDEARAKAEKLHEAVVDGGDFDELASDNPASIEYAPGAPEAGDPVWIKQGASDDKALDGAIFALSPGEYSGVVESDDGYRIVKVEEVRPALDRKLEDVRLEIAGQLLVKERALELARKGAEELLAAVVAAGNDLGAAVDAAVAADSIDGAVEPADDEDDDQSARLAVAETGMFDQSGGTGEMNPANPFAFQKPWDSIPKIGRSAELSKAAFSLTGDSPVSDQVFLVNDAWYVVRLKERQDADMDAFADAKEELSEKLRSERVKEMMGDWRTNLFGPAYQRRMFGNDPDHGILVGRIVDPARHGSKVKINEGLFTFIEQVEAGDDGDDEAADSAADSPSGGVAEGVEG